MKNRPKYPGTRITSDGNTLVGYHTEARLADAGIFYPITASTQMGEQYQLCYAEGRMTVFGGQLLAIETEGEHAAQGGAIAYSVTGKRVVNFTSGQGIVYGVEQYYHAPGKLSTMVLEVAARALTKHALNVHCGHDDVYAALDTGWTMLFAKDAQQAADQALILRRVTELSLTPGMNIMDGFLTSHLERTFFRPDAGLIREFMGAPDDIIDCPSEPQRALFGPTRRRVPKVINLKNPALIGPVQNQEHYMNGVFARRNNFYEDIPDFLEDAYEAFGELTGRYYSFLTEYRTEDADTVFVSLGSAAENIDAACDYLIETRGESVGSIHVNMLRPFPCDAIANALRGKKRVIVMERSDEALSEDNPLTRGIRTALAQAMERGQLGVTDAGASLSPDEIPRILSGVYGLGSRDFRPEAIIGAYEFATGQTARQDGKTAADGTSLFTVGIDHPYAVGSDEKPSLLPKGAIAVRLHSIGGWGMITTGKNLGAIIGNLGDYIAEQKDVRDEHGRLEEALHISANPRYGSEKKGAPTNYFLVVAKERVRVNCDLRHVNVVLCCDPKAFTHTNPLDGLTDGGAFVWESDEAPEVAWQRIPAHHRQEVIDRKIRLYTLAGFDIAAAATDRPDLRQRMQGNAFLGAFFGVSSFLDDYDITPEHFRRVVRAQYESKFGRFGAAVVESNMQVMTQGFDRVTEIPYGNIEAADRADMRGNPLLPRVSTDSLPVIGQIAAPAAQIGRAPMHSTAYFDAEYRSGLGYDQPASPLAAVGIMAAGTGATTSKYVARRETPVYIAENCTQCMDCITACPDTALPNTVQDVSTVLTTAIDYYVSEPEQRALLNEQVKFIENEARAQMVTSVAEKTQVPFKTIVRNVVRELGHGISFQAKVQLCEVIDLLPLAYSKTKALFASKEKRSPGEGGIFSIFVSDLCKGCGECVTECGDHEALKMVPDSEDNNADVIGSTAFMDLLPETQTKHLGRYDPDMPMNANMGTVKNHLMLRGAYQALVSGDGACAGCGEKTVLRAITTITETYMRAVYHHKSNRLSEKATVLNEMGVARLAALEAADPERYDWLKLGVAHILMGLGGENDDDTRARVAAADDITHEGMVEAISAVMRQDAFNHKSLQAIDGRLANGMAVMAMAASTGCNTVYGSTPPNNPHAYPWMNSLFQDGATVGWMFAESFIRNHAARSVAPERLCDAIMAEDSAGISESDFFELTHMTDNIMTDREIMELPKVWTVGGDGAMGDIGFQNLSKAILQNRPNMQVVLLDTQVYSNTGGQNSDSSTMLGGGDMNAFGLATQGKLTEKKSVSEILSVGHGSPFVVQLSMANSGKFYRAVMDVLEYRGVGFMQAFTTCQPEHGVGDDMSTKQAQSIRDSRGMPDFISNPSLGETGSETIDVRSNPSYNGDWHQVKSSLREEKYTYFVAHWAVTEARFRRHHKVDKKGQGKYPLDDFLLRLNQRDVVNRRHLVKDHRAYTPDFEVYIDADEGGKVVRRILSRQMVLFCVERRKAWRMLQDRAGVKNLDYKAHQSLLKKVDGGKVPLDEFLADTPGHFAAERAAMAAK